MAFLSPGEMAFLSPPPFPPVTGTGPSSSLLQISPITIKTTQRPHPISSSLESAAEREGERGMAPKLPDEMIEEILSRLPVKSLLRFKCVCKAWRSLISSPQFAKTHLHKHPITRVLLSSEDCIPPFVDPARTYGLAVDLEFPLVLSTSRGSAAILDSCDGLLCLVDGFYHFDIHHPSHELVLWNPSTRQFNHIPSPSSVNYSSCLYGFGYDSSIDDYKVVRVFSSNTTHKTGIDVFTLKTNDWKKIEETHASVIEYELGTCFNGSIHWLAHRYNSVAKRCLIVAFDFAEEKFREMELPNESIFFGLRVLGGFLCLAGLNSYGLYSDEMWVMEEYGIKESWKRLVTFPYGPVRDSIGRFPRVLRSLENGQLLAMVNAEELMLCDTKENRWENVTTYRWSRLFQLDVALYIETLVSPFGDSGIDAAESSKKRKNMGERKWKQNADRWESDEEEEMESNEEKEDK